jgi:hypothetical protein
VPSFEALSKDALLIVTTCQVPGGIRDKRRSALNDGCAGDRELLESFSVITIAGRGHRVGCA